MIYLLTQAVLPDMLVDGVHDPGIRWIPEEEWHREDDHGSTGWQVGHWVQEACWTAS
jgi:hypothetical protein